MCTVMLFCIFIYMGLNLRQVDFKKKDPNNIFVAAFFVNI